MMQRRTFLAVLAVTTVLGIVVVLLLFHAPHHDFPQLKVPGELLFDAKRQGIPSTLDQVYTSQLEIPGEIDLGEIPPTAGEVRFSIRNLGSSNIKLTIAETSDAAISAKIPKEGVAARGSCDVTVVYDWRKARGYRQGAVWLTPAADNGARVCLSMTALVHPTGSIPEGRRPLIAAVSDLLRHYRQAIQPTFADNSWDIAHYSLAMGPAASVVGPGGAMPAATYLVRHARGDETEMLFVAAADGALAAHTDTQPRERYQDHRNQIFTYLVDTASVGQQRAVPIGLRYDEFIALSKGAWKEYTLAEEPSWTLCCYLRVGPDALGVPADTMYERVQEIVEELLSKDDEQWACQGAHAAYALASFLASTESQRYPQALRLRVKHRLEQEFEKLTETEAVLASQRHMTPLIKSLAVVSLSGHGLEWLSLYLPPDRLDDPKVTQIVWRLHDAMTSLETMSVGRRGGIFHALHGMRLYLGRLVE